MAGGAWQLTCPAARRSSSTTSPRSRADRNSRAPDDRADASRARLRSSAASGPVSSGPHVVLVGGEGEAHRATEYETRYSPHGRASPVRSSPEGTRPSDRCTDAPAWPPSEHVTIVLGARGDFWQSTPRETTAPARSVSLLSPNVSIAWQISPEITARAAAYRAYRTPTLDELHRGSRQGDVLTNPNPLLDPERLTGVEGSVRWARSRASARLTGFFNNLDGMVTNITLSVTPTLITRQKDNVDKSRAAGVEIESDFRPNRAVTINALAVFTSSDFLEAPLSRLAGNRVPQMPVYQLGGGVTVAAPDATTVNVQARGHRHAVRRRPEQAGAGGVLGAGRVRQPRDRPAAARRSSPSKTCSTSSTTSAGRPIGPSACRVPSAAACGCSCRKIGRCGQVSVARGHHLHGCSWQPCRWARRRCHVALRPSRPRDSGTTDGALHADGRRRAPSSAVLLTGRELEAIRSRCRAPSSSARSRADAFASPPIPAAFWRVEVLRSLRDRPAAAERRRVGPARLARRIGLGGVRPRRLQGDRVRAAARVAAGASSRRLGAASGRVAAHEFAHQI